MDYLKSLLIFGKVLDLGSMSAVAKELGVSASAVSQHLNQLEQHYKMKLLNRTTRKLTPTQEGQILWQGATAVRQQLEQMNDQLQLARNEFAGTVRISLPSGFLQSAAIQKFIHKMNVDHPQIQLDLYPDDKLTDLIDGTIDVAIRAAEPPSDSQLIARYLSAWQLGIYATPDYLLHHPIKTAEELSQQCWINFNERVFNDAFNSLNLGNFKAKNAITCHSILAARSLVVQGLGLTLQLSGEVESYVQRGELVQVLPELRLPKYNLYAITAYRVQSAKVDIVLRVLKSLFNGC